MQNLLTHHPDDQVRAALIRLLDALCSWERSTGHENILIVKDSVGCEYRSFTGAPVAEHVGDHQLIETFDEILRRKAE